MKFFAAALIATAAIAVPASAAERRAFDQAAFAAAQAKGKPTIVEVHAPWCPVCASQNKTIDKLTANNAYPDLVIFRIDFDTQKPVWQKFGAQKQSTLIAFRGKKETSRIAYQTDEAKIAALLASTRS